ncbi:SDR family NAD(P)-dependent oxidoreductase [Aeromicrobium sp. NPDC092404]|uniref:SDR family NAD(P)-dependent oxidoreductase n=1 Tax=Aeromicrobium sp. NPDC092404 TaxID=3154976 RepID=UPI003432E420
MEHTTDEAGRRPLGLVTGASSGIGEGLAREMVSNGFDLVVVAEDEGIVDIAAELSDLADVQALRADLATRSGNDMVTDFLAQQGRPVAAAAINAGIGVHGRLVETELDDHLRLIALNIVSAVHLGRWVAKDMVTNGGGRLLFTSSVASQMPGPFYTTYAASKSFIQSFALGLREELQDTAVTVTSLMPGPTDTDFFERAGMDGTKVAEGPKDDPADVAKAGFAAMMAGDDHVVTGWRNKLQSAAAGVLPDAVAAKVHRSMTEPLT